MQSIPKISLAVASLGLAMLFTSTPCLRAQTSMAPAAPLPSQILTAKKVFISNSGGGFDKVSWTGGPDRIYNEFYATVKSWGRYELVSAPGDADLVFEVNVIWTPGFAQFKLEILDPKSRIVLWTVYEPIKFNGLLKTRDKSFDDAIDKLVGDLKAITTQSAAAN